MVRPIKTFLLLLLVNGLLGVLVYVFPNGKIALSKELAIKFLPLRDLLQKQDVKYADISGIITEKPQVNIDSAVSASSAPVKDTTKINAKADLSKLLSLRYRIQYGDSISSPLAAFFQQLDALREDKSKFVRIVHYGDSQIEGDRITGTLRDKLQQQFGGCGAGTVPVFDVADIRSSISLSCSQNWKKFAVYGGMYKSAHTNLFGMQGCFFRLLSDKDTSGQVIPGPKQGWIAFKNSSTSYAGTRRFQLLKLYFAHTTASVNLKIYSNNKLIISDTLGVSDDFQVKSWTINASNDNLRIEFGTSGSIDVYGIGFDPVSGIEVDNAAMRGSSGLDLSKISAQYLSRQLKVLNTRLLIIQYGVNLAPYEVPSYDFYEKSFYNELKHIKDNLPGVSILVVGVSDVSKNVDGQYVTSPNIVKIRDAQKAAAFKAGCAFWDLFEAMGGENSMPGWVDAKPSLAQKDYTHFSPQGARIVGDMLYNALMTEYLSYKESHENL